MKMNPIAALIAFNWSAPKTRALDLGLSLATALAGFYFDNQFVLWLGLVAVVFAIINPMGRLQVFLKSFKKAPGA